MEAIRTQREKQRTEVPVEESAPARDAAAPLDGNGAVADGSVVPSSDDSWVIKLEQSFNIFATVIQSAHHNSSRLICSPPLQNPVPSGWSWSHVLFLSAGFGDYGTQGRVR